MRKKTIVCFLLLSILMGILPPPLPAKASSTYSGIDAADLLDSFQVIPPSTPTYTAKGYYVGNEGLDVRVAKVWIDNPSEQVKGRPYIYNMVDVRYNTANGYLLIDAADLEAWIAYFGQTSNPAYTAYVASQLADKKITLTSTSFQTYTFYPYALVANYAGGAPGDVDWVPVNGGNNYRITIKEHRRYNTEYRHSINMTAPKEAQAGEPVTITLSTSDGSIFYTQQQNWNLSIDGPDGRIQKLNDYKLYPDLSTRTAVHSVQHTFVKSGTYTITFEVEDASFHNNARTGTTQYSVTQQVNVRGELKADFDVIPGSIRYGDSFTLHPKDIKIPAGRTVAKIEYTIYDHERTRSHKVTTYSAQDRTIPFSQYPSFFSSTTNQTYPIDMVLTDNTGESTPVVTKSLTIKANELSADFDILPGQNLTFRDSFSLVPKNIQTDNLTYSYHRFRIRRDGNTYITPRIYGINEGISFNYATYPYVIGIGTHTVDIEVVTKEGPSTGWVAAKPLAMTSPTVNSPPVFQVAWVRPNDPTQTPVTQVVQGDQLDLILLDNPPPYDPDGDEIYWLGFDFSDSSAWAKTIPSKYQEYVNGYHNITMEELGFQTAKGTMRDRWGASATRSAYVTVVPPNPIPIAICPPEVKENRPVDPSLFDASRSYSPAGRAIDHSRDEWTNVKPSYVNGTTADIVMKATLHVYDTLGLKSLQPAECTFIVKPDLPPIGELGVPPLAIRNQDVDVFNQSYSPDEDRIVSAQYRYKYDDENNGFDDDPWVNLAGTLAKETFKPAQVGKYVFDVWVCEDYGRCAWASDTQPEAQRTLDVVNLAPSVSFRMEGENEQPNPDNTVRLNAIDILNSWQYYGVNSTSAGLFINAKWFHVNGVLQAGIGYNFRPNNMEYNTTSATRSGINYYYQYYPPFIDNGYGPNSLSPFRAIQSIDEPLWVQPLLHDRYGYWQPITEPAKVQANDKYIYYSYRESNDPESIKIYAMNIAKIGRVRGDITHNGSYITGFEYQLLDGSPIDFTFSVSNAGNQSRQFKQFEYRNGQLVPRSITETGFLQGIQDFTLSDRTLYVTYEWKCRCLYNFSDGSYDNLFFYELRTYDAYTGQFIASSFEDPNQIQPNNYELSDNMMLMSHGDDMIAMQNYWGPKKAVRYNRQAQKVKEGMLNTQPDYSYTKDYETILCRTGTDNHVFRDEKGNFYFYEYSDCRYQSGGAPMTENKSWFTKYNADFTFAWRVQLKGRYPTYRNSVDWGFQIPYDDHFVAFYDPFRSEMVVRSYNIEGFGYQRFYEAINVNTGAKRDWNWETYHFSAWDTNFGLRWDGSLGPGGSYTPDNMRTVNSAVWKPDGSSLANWEVYYILNMNTMCATSTDGIRYGQYIGDGLLLTAHTTNTCGYHYETFTYAITKGTPTSGSVNTSATSLGQFVSPFTKSDIQLEFSFNMHTAKLNNKLAGFSFRMSDPRNRYAVETDGTNLYLSKYVNGARTVLKQSSYPFQDNTEYRFKVVAVGNQMEVYLNNVPYLTATDSSFASGKLGPFSDKPNVAFWNMALKEVSAPTVEWMAAYAIWEEGEASATVRYKNITFADPENDPRAGNWEWSYTHTPRFLNHQGVSALHGKTFSSEQLKFDKVGDYVVTLKAKDDPNPSYRYPSMVFDEYRKSSNPFQQMITVHRRPVAVFTLSFNPDKTVKWTDTSYDPDRWLSPTNYSTEPTGIDYAATRGILERKYYYVTPSGVKVDQKLVAPTEAGTYSVGMAVKDEYGAWSYWVEQTLTVTHPVPPDEPPHAGFTLSKTTAYRGEPITVTSTAWDKEDGGSANLPHEYYAQNVNGGPEYFQSNNRTTWTKTFTTLGTFNFRQVVYDSKGQSAQAVRQITIVNRKPVTQVTMPSGTSASAPTELYEAQPTIQFTYADADGDAQQTFRIVIRNASTNAIVVQSGDVTSAATSWKVSIPLAEGVYAVESQVFDGYDWSDVSARKYMRIVLNRPPVADFDWTPKPVWEGDTVTLINLSTDPDGDRLSFHWTVRQPDGAVRSFTSVEPEMRFSLPGTYSVTLNASDGKLDHETVKTIQALPLTLEGDVSHTPGWLEYHVSKGHEVERHPKDFYAGEKLVLTALTSPVPTLRVIARLEATGIDGSPLRTQTALVPGDAVGRYIGELYDERWMSLDAGLPNGIHTVRFEVEYANGTVKTADVPIRIIGSTLGTAGVHRVR